MNLRVFSLVLLLGGVGLAQTDVDVEGAKYLSLVSLIASGEKFDKQKVMTCGVLKVAFEGTALFLSKEHKAAGDWASAVWVDFQIGSKELEKKYGKFDGKWVCVRAEFQYGMKGHMGVYSGGLTNIAEITSCEPN